MSSDVERELEKAALLRNFKNRLDALTEEFENFKEESVTKDEVAEYFTQDVEIASVETGGSYVSFELSDERIIKIPVWWNKKLRDADLRDAGHEVSEDGKRVRWPDVDAVLSLKGILQGSPPDA